MTPSQSVSQTQVKVCEALRSDLDRQLADNVVLPAVIAADASGGLLPKTLMPLDTGGQPISDAEMVELIRRALESKGEVPAVIGWVRLDLDLPEIISVELESGRVWQLRPRHDSDGSLTWQTHLSEELDATPRGGSGGEGEDAGATLMRSGASEELKANAALEHIGHDAVKRLTQLVESSEAASSADVPDEAMLDRGTHWAHADVPPAATEDIPLDERLKQLRDHVRALETPTTAIRFRHEDSIYIFGLHSTAEIESGFLIRTAIDWPGQLGEIEGFSSDDLARLLGQEGSE